MSPALNPTALSTAGSDFRAGSTPSWADVAGHFTKGPWFWFATVRADGAPHVRPTFAAWSDPVLFVASNRESVKSRNLERDSRCTLSKDAEDLHLVVEGHATRVVDAAGLAAASAAFAAVYDWPTTVSDDQLDAPYGAPTSGGPPYSVYAVTPQRVYTFPVDDGGFAPTRWS